MTHHAAPQHDDIISGLVVTLAGDPIGWPRPRFVHGRVIPATGKAKRYASALERAARDAVANLGGTDAVRMAFASHGLAVSISATFATRHVKRHGLPHTHKPDGDNIAKLMDALVRAGAMGGDDSRVADLTVTKLWGPTGSLSFVVRPVADKPSPARPVVGAQAPAWLTGPAKAKRKRASL